MYNLHTHSLLSDGCLLPSEIAVRYQAFRYKAIAITDHVDYSNIKQTVDAILKFCRHWPKKSTIKVLPGIELTHLPLDQFKPLVKFARSKGIKIIVGHGESPVEPVIAGTNHAAIEAGVDILAHPGFITDADTKLAKKKNVLLEITTRHGHCKTNRHVAGIAKKFGAKLIISHDSHAPKDIISIKKTKSFARQAGITLKDIDKIYRNIEKFIKEEK